VIVLESNNFTSAQESQLLQMHEHRVIWRRRKYCT